MIRSRPQGIATVPFLSTSIDKIHVFLNFSHEDALTVLKYPVAWGGVKLFKPGQKGMPVQIPLSPITKGTMDEEALYELLSSGEKVHTPPL